MIHIYYRSHPGNNLFMRDLIRTPWFNFYVSGALCLSLSRTSLSYAAFESSAYSRIDRWKSGKIGASYHRNKTNTDEKRFFSASLDRATEIASSLFPTGEWNGGDRKRSSLWVRIWMFVFITGGNETAHVEAFLFFLLIFFLSSQDRDVYLRLVGWLPGFGNEHREVGFRSPF